MFLVSFFLIVNVIFLSRQFSALSIYLESLKTESHDTPFASTTDQKCLNKLSIVAYALINFQGSFYRIFESNNLL